MIRNTDVDDMESKTSSAEGFGACGFMPDFLADFLDEPTVELKCSCGSWVTYGRSCSPALHTDRCDLRR